MSEGCSNCGATRHGRAKRCAACDRYYYRNKRQERPEEVMIEATRRRVLNRLEAQIRRQAELYRDDSLTA